MTAAVAIALLVAVTSAAIAVAYGATRRARAARVALLASNQKHDETVELARKLEASSRLAGLPPSSLPPKKISGTFANLPDGSTFTVGRNTLQANYKGGDGNDLTLTVVP